MFNSKMCLVRHIKNTNKNNILKIYVCNYAQLLQDIRNVLFIEQLAKRLKESLFMARLAKKKEKHPL
jgi:hypothetical protein